MVVADDLSRRSVGDIMVFEQYPAALHLSQPHQRFHKLRLAVSVDSCDT